MKESNVKYIHYYLGDYVPIVGNYENPKNIISSKYAIQLPEKYWKLFTIKLPDMLI